MGTDGRAIDRIREIAISSNINAMVPGSQGLIQRLYVKAGEEMGEGIKVEISVKELFVSTDGKIITCGPEYDERVQQWEKTTRKLVGELMKGNEENYLLNEMKRACCVVIENVILSREKRTFY